MFRCFAILSVFLVLAAEAQDSGPRDGFDVRIWQSDEGLPGNVVRSVGQTEDGFLWLATAEGISRFDGIEFRNIPATESVPGRASKLFRIFTPADGSVWASTFDSGLCRIENGGVSWVIRDSDDDTAGAITRLFTHAGSTYVVEKDAILEIEGSETVLVESPDPGLERANRNDLEQQNRRGRGEESRVTGHEGGVWTINEGLLAYEPPVSGEGSPASPRFGRPFAALDMLEDSEGNLWVASPVQGLVRIRRNRVMRLASDSGAYEPPALAVIRSRDGTWWIANRNGGVDSIRNGTRRFHTLYPGNFTRAVSCIFEDGAGTLWFATRDASVFRYVPELDSFEPFSVATPGFSKISSIAEDSQGRLWLGGRSGLFRWDGETVVRLSGQEPDGVDVATLSFDSEERLFIGTNGGRVMTFDGERASPLGSQEKLPLKTISGILPLDPDEVWVSTLGAGLYLWKDGRWRQFDSGSGIPDERLTSVALVDDTLWMGSLGGILSVSRDHLLRGGRDGEMLPVWRRLDRSDGMATRECTGTGQPAVFRDADDSLWFPTTSGVAGIRAARIETNEVPPSLHLQSVEANGVPVALTGDSVEVGPGRSRLEFRFIGVSLSAPEKVTYQVRLAGLENEAQNIGRERRINYPAVPPGSYFFELSAINGDGVPTERPLTLPVVIRPHFWETTWFGAGIAILLLLLTLAVGWYSARRRMKWKIRELRLRGALEDERSRISRDLHDDLGASLTELSILSALAAEETDDQALLPSLNHLSLKAKRAVGDLDEIVWATTPKQDSLRSLVEYLVFFTREFLRHVNVQLRTDLVKEIPDVGIGPRRRHNVLLATREAINNAVKHGEPETVFLRIAIEEGRLVVEIRDDGKGFLADYGGSGDGLTNLRLRMADSGGDCRIESLPRTGTTVTLTLPLPVVS